MRVADAIMDAENEAREMGSKTVIGYMVRIMAIAGEEDSNVYGMMRQKTGMRERAAENPGLNRIGRRRGSEVFDCRAEQ